MNKLKQMLNMIDEIDQEASELRLILKPAEKIANQIARIENSGSDDDKQLVYLYSKLDELCEKAKSYDMTREEFILLGPQINGQPPNKQKKRGG